MKREKRNARGGLALPVDIGGYQRDAGELYGLNPLDREGGGPAAQEPLFDSFGPHAQGQNDWEKLFRRKLADISASEKVEPPT